MRRRKSEGINRVIDASGGPKMTAQEALDNNLYYKLRQKFLENRTVDETADAIAEGVKARDAKFVRIATDFIMAEQPRQVESATVNVQNNITNQAFYFGTDGVRVAELDIQRNAVFVIAVKGPMSLDDLARQFHLVQPQIRDALGKSPWFIRKGDAYEVTNQGRAEVLEQLR